jgi:hypothetical protein
MATYPDDATAPVTAFGVVSDVIYSSTGATRTDFNLGATATHRGEVVAFIDGILQQTSGYDLSNSGQTVSFLTAPNASNLTLKTVSLPSRFRLTRSFPAVRAIDYSNTTATVVNSNSFLINSNTESFALPEGVNVTNSSDFMVYLSGVFQNPDSYTFPSTVYGSNGIDIGDNTAAKLILNFETSLTDDSPSAHTVTAVPSATYSDGAFNFQGTNFLRVPSSSDFNVHLTDFTHDLEFRLTVDAMASDQALYARYQDISNYYMLKYTGANSNIGFMVNTAGSMTEVYGGNVNALSNYHVAVSYERNEQNLRLYVNNVLVGHTNYTALSSPTGPLELGNANALVNTLDGTVNFYRFAESSRYRTASIQPLAPTLGYQATPISAAPLGAVDAADTLSIRVFDSEVTSTDRFNSMADRKPDKGFTSERKFDTITFESQAGYEKRRLRSRRSKRAYSLKYTNVTGIEKTAIENFYNARSGEFEAFTFDLTHINESGTITTRFDGPLSVNHTLSAGSELTENFYTVSFKLQETYD